MEQSVGFYKDILGMPLKYQTMSGLSSRPEPLLSHFTYQNSGSSPATPQREIVAGASTIGFTVTDLDKT